MRQEQQPHARQRAEQQQRLNEIAANDRVRIEEAEKEGALWTELGQFSISIEGWSRIS